MIEAGYVGTSGRDLVSKTNINVVPYGALNSGTIGNADLSVPVNRVALDAGVVNSRRPFPVYGAITPFEYEGTSQYHSLQVTLSRQTTKRLQYFVAYTLSRSEGTLSGEYFPRDPFDPAKTYGTLETDRRHILNTSRNAILPDFARGPVDSVVGRGLLNGWQLSGISTKIPANLRAPWRSTHDVTLFKNFAIRGSQRLQFRAGFFNIFNTASASTNISSADVDLTLQTTCNRRVNYVPNGAGGYVDDVCDPSGGFSYTQNTLDNFGRINLKRGHRVIELVVKNYF